MLTKTLTVTAILVATATLTHAQPSKGNLKSAAPASLSYRSQGGILGTKMGIDIDPSGAAFAFTNQKGLASRVWGQVNKADLQNLQSAADAFFADRNRSLGGGVGTLSHTIMRKTAAGTQYFETFSPQGRVAALVQMFQKAHAAVLANGSKAASPQFRSRNATVAGLPSMTNRGTVPQIIVCPKGPSSKGNGAVVGGSQNPASQGRTGTVGSGAKSGPVSQGRTGTVAGLPSMTNGGTVPQIIVCPKGPSSKSNGAVVGGSQNPASQGQTGTVGGSSKSNPVSQGRTGTVGGAPIGGRAGTVGGGQVGKVKRPPKGYGG